MNAVCAVEAAKSDCAEVLVCMHASESDDVCALHRGTRVRKNHTSRRDAFETVGAKPLGEVDYGIASEDDSGAASGVSYRRLHRERGGVVPSIQPELEADVELLKFAPGMDEAQFEALADPKGLVVEGTGLGHVHTKYIPTLESMVDSGTTVVMTSQCLEGRVCDRVYDTGRDLLDAGVIEGEDMLPGTAMVKLMWVLEHSDRPAETMRRPLAGELTEQSRPWE
jgi:glutamyl-tRNA(Gln) amidotransferase subunit D